MLNPIIHVDATPDEDYPIRILRAYRRNCDWRWSSTTDGGDETNPLVITMNELNDKRVALLDKAIALLENENQRSRTKGK